MKNILTVKEAVELSGELKKQGKQIVLTGGCFDILHPGHFKFLENAKKTGGILMVFVESDKKITEIKGKERPLHTQQERAEMISSLRFVDFAVLLPYFQTDEDYDRLIQEIKPDIIAATENDPGLDHKKRQAEKTQAKLVTVTKYIQHKSTTRVLKLLSKEQ